MDAAKPRKAEERMIARRLILGAAIAAGVLGVAPKVAAQGNPEKPIKLIVPSSRTAVVRTRMPVLAGMSGRITINCCMIATWATGPNDVTGS